MSYYSRIIATCISVVTPSVIEPIRESTGIYFDPAGTLKISNNYLHVLVPIDVGYIKPHLENIKVALGTARFICQQNELSVSKCHNFLQPLTSRFDNVLKDYNAISHLISNREKRSAWFAGIGSMFKQLIGTMDEDDSIKYNTAIQHLENNDKKLSFLLKDNILMTNTALEKYNKTLYLIQVNEARMGIAIENLSNVINNISNLPRELYMESKMNELYNELSSSLLTLSFSLEDIINAIMFTKSHSIHPSVLTPKQLYDELMRNVKDLTKNCELPISLSLDNIHALCDIAQLSCYFSNNKIVFVVKIPLVHKSEYIVYKSIPVPIPHDKEQPNSYAMIIPHCNHIAISRDKLMYVCLKDISKCSITINQIYICKDLEPLSMQDLPTCETEMLCKIINKLPQQCETRLIHGNIDTWQELKGNKWLFVKSQPTKLTLECDSHISEYKLLGTGTIYVNPDCKAYCRDKVLTSKPSYNITTAPVISDFNLINDPCCDKSKFLSIKSNLKPLKLYDMHLEKLVSTSNDQVLSNIDKIINEPGPFIKYESHYPILTYCLIILTLVFILYRLIIVICKKFGICPTHDNTFEPNNISDEGQELEEIPAPRLRIVS